MEAGEGIISKPSRYTVLETIEKLKAILDAKGITIFALIDHSGEAAKVEMKMPPAQLLIFGNPRAGTPVMQAAPLAAIDLPLKALAWEDSGGKVWLSYNDPGYLKRRFSLGDDAIKTISGIGNVIQQALV